MIPGARSWWPWALSQGAGRARRDGRKGPHVAWLNALAAIIAVEGTLPVNVMFLAEGEEILGSPTYRGVRRAIFRPAEQRRRQLRPCHVAERCGHRHGRPRPEGHGRARADRQRRRLGPGSGEDHP